MPPAERPCGRTADAANRSSWASDVTNTSSAESACAAARSTAPTTSSPSLSEMTSQASLPGRSGTTRLTTPDAVPSASPASASVSEARATTRSPASSVTYSLSGPPPASDSGPAVGGTAGMSTTPSRSTRPAEVTTPTWPRAVARTREATTSCAARSPGAGGSGASRAGGARQQAGGRQQHPAGVVADLERRRGGAGRGLPGALQQHRAARRPVGLRHLGELVGDHRPQPALVAEDLLEPRDLGDQLVALGLQLDPGEPGQPAQPQLEDVLGLRLGQVEHLDQPRPRRLGVVAGPDHLDHLVDVEDRHQEALDQVQPLAPLRQPVRGAAADDVEAVRDVDLEQLLEAERARLALDQADVVDAERVLHRREPVELLEHGVGVEAGLHLDHQPQPVAAVGEVGDRRDALQLLGLDGVLDLLDHLLRADGVRQLGDDDALAARGDALDPGGGAGAEGPAPGGVRLADAVEPDDLAAGGQVGAGDEAHQRVEGGVGVG